MSRTRTDESKSIRANHSITPEKVLKTIKKLNFDDKTLERMGATLQNTNSKRRQRYKSTLRCLILEAIVLSIWMILGIAGQVYDFVRCVYNCEAEFARLQCLGQNDVIFAAILIIITDMLANYGMFKWNFLFMLPGLLVRLLALLYFGIMALIYVALPWLWNWIQLGPKEAMKNFWFHQAEFWTMDKQILALWTFMLITTSKEFINQVSDMLDFPKPK